MRSDTLLSAADGPSARILIIEDDLDVSNLVAGLLQKSGYLVRQSFDGQNGLAMALKETFDLILLDVLMPKMDGLELMHRLRKRSDIPVIMVTARGTERDRIAGLKVGADDYLPKPFNLEELLLRVEAVMKRARVSLTRPPLVRTTLNVDGLQLDMKNNTASYNKVPFVLTQMEWRLLVQLIENQHQVLSKPYLYQELMGRSYSRDERSLDVHVSKLRRKLKKIGFHSKQIHTIHGQGYCFK